LFGSTEVEELETELLLFDTETDEEDFVWLTLEDDFVAEIELLDLVTLRLELDDFV